jgi:hypothetical protein
LFVLFIRRGASINILKAYTEQQKTPL